MSDTNIHPKVNSWYVFGVPTVSRITLRSFNLSLSAMMPQQLEGPIRDIRVELHWESLTSLQLLTSYPHRAKFVLLLDFVCISHRQRLWYCVIITDIWNILWCNFELYQSSYRQQMQWDPCLYHKSQRCPLSRSENHNNMILTKFQLHV